MTQNRPPQTVSFNPKVIRYALLGFLIFLLFIILTNTTFLTIDPGHHGVLFKRFGGGLKMDKIYEQGFHVVAPWNKMYIYDTRIQESFETLDVLSKNGLNIAVELSYRYFPKRDRIGYLHDQVGTSYHDIIIKPEIRSATREVIGKYLPEELYSDKREVIQQEIFDQTADAVSVKDVELDAVLIRGVVLPKTLQEAIERKLKEEQSSLEYEFRLDRERKEAERRIIEAEAKAEANRILSASITSNILRDKGIEATLTLAQSPNSKIVVVGSGEDGLPLILNN